MFNFFSKTDSQIQLDVLKEINWDPSITSSQVSVTANDGIVTLRGSVPHYFEKSKAEDAAQRVGGVRAVADEIEVNLMGSYNRSDEQIAEAALNAIQWSYSVPAGIKVTVEKGWVTYLPVEEDDPEMIAEEPTTKIYSKKIIDIPESAKVISSDQPTPWLDQDTPSSTH